MTALALMLLVAATPARVPAPTFSARDITGHVWNLKKLSGKVVVLNFWEISCGPCVAEFPTLDALTRAFPKGDVVFLALTADPASRVRRFLARHPVRYAVIADAEAEQATYFVRSWPTHLVIDRTGRVAARFSRGLDSPERLRKIISAVRANRPLADPKAEAQARWPLAAQVLPLPHLPASLTRALARMKSKGHADRAAQLRAAILRAANESSRLPGSRIVVGRVQVEAPFDPQRVRFQSRIFPEGWFATLVKPLPGMLVFWAEGHRPRQVQLDGGPPSDGVIDIGPVHLQPLAKGDYARLSGRIEMPPGLSHPSLTVTLGSPPVDTPSNGTEPRSEWPSPHPVAVHQDGSFDVGGLTPVANWVVARCDGCLTSHTEVTLGAGMTTKLDLHLERQKRMRVDYVIGSHPPLAGPIQTTILAGGEDFRPEAPGLPPSLFRLQQVNGRFRARVFYARLRAYALPTDAELTGEKVSELESGKQLRYDFPLEEAGTYAFRDPRSGTWVVVRVRTEPSGDP